MSETPDVEPIAGMPAALRGASLMQIGGALGIAACVVGLLIFIVVCAGFNAVFFFSFIPLLLSGPGLVLSILGGVGRRGLAEADTHVLSAIFVNIMGLTGGIVLVAAWRQWPIFG